MAAGSFVQPPAHLDEPSPDLPPELLLAPPLLIRSSCRAGCGPSMVDGPARGANGTNGEDEMKKMNRKSKDQPITEQDLSDLTIKKLTLKTGVKAGMMGTCEVSCCPKTCHG
jgi:hypothetical protein